MTRVEATSILRWFSQFKFLNPGELYGVEIIELRLICVEITEKHGTLYVIFFTQAMNYVPKDGKQKPSQFYNTSLTFKNKRHDVSWRIKFIFDIGTGSWD